MRPTGGNHAFNQPYRLGFGDIIKGHAQDGDGRTENGRNIQGDSGAHNSVPMNSWSQQRHSSSTCGAATATAPAKPGAGFSSPSDQSEVPAKRPGRFSRQAGSPGRNDTSTWLSKWAIPSPVAFSQASLRVQRLKKAALLCASGNCLNRLISA